MLGTDLVAVLVARGFAVHAPGHGELDITDAAAVRRAILGYDLVVNTAAWTDVDGAERDEAAATRANGAAVAEVATACAAVGARLIHLSTDYVFDGSATSPYPEDARPNPINAYGRGKLAGEIAVRQLAPDVGYVVRTAWLYGAHGKNFVSTMLRLASERDRVDVVCDQIGQPTWSWSLAERLADLGAAALGGSAPTGVYHLTAGGSTTWYDLARAVFAAAGLDPERVHAITSDRFPRPARRPAYSVLGNARWRAIGLSPLPDWRIMLAAALPTMVVP